MLFVSSGDEAIPTLSARVEIALAETTAKKAVVSTSQRHAGVVRCNMLLTITELHETIELCKWFLYIRATRIIRSIRVDALR